MGKWPPGEAEALRELGRRVRLARKKAGYTQETLGEKASLHRTFVGQLERGEKNPTAWTLIRVAWGLGVDPGTLIEGLEPRFD